MPDFRSLATSEAGSRAPCEKLSTLRISPQPSPRERSPATSRRVTSSSEARRATWRSIVQARFHSGGGSSRSTRASSAQSAGARAAANSKDAIQFMGQILAPRAPRPAGLFVINCQGTFLGLERRYIVEKLMECNDPVRSALVHGESAPAEFASWPVPEVLRRMRIRFRLNRKQLAAKAGVSASLVGRAEKGADIRLSTLKRLYAAMGCRLVALPAGALYDLDWRQAHLDNEWLDWKAKAR